MYRRRQELSMSNKPKMAYSRDLAYMDYYGLLWTIMDYYGLSWTFMDNHGL